ncbi:hypothetical protein BDV12DRAFT_198191 [Aspergillus spectabilis]
MIGLVHNKAAAEEKAKTQELTNAHFFEAQYTDLASLKNAAEEVKKITGGDLNYLVNNAASPRQLRHIESRRPRTFEVNVLGVIKTTEAFPPLIQVVPEGSDKKVVTITSGMSDAKLINPVVIPYAAPYSISKGALNVAIAKYNALYKDEGILFFGVCPGIIRTERQSHGLERRRRRFPPHDCSWAKIIAIKPDFAGQITPEESAIVVLGLAHKATIEEFGSDYVSRFSTKKWFP